MKKLFVFALGLSFCIFFGISSFEFFLRAIPNDFNLKLQNLNQNKNDIEVLILGSSHTYVGVDPNFIDKKAFNLAYSSQTLDLDNLIFNEHKSRLNQLKTVIIPISYFSYALALEDGSSAHKIKNYNIYYQLFSHTIKLENQFEIFHQPFLANYNDLKTYFKNPKFKIAVDQNGFIKKRFVKQNLDWEESAFHAAKNHTLNFGDEQTKIRISQNINALEQIISWCKIHQVKVILVSTPTTNSYLEKLNQEQFIHWKNTTQKIVDDNDEVIWLNFLEDNSKFDVSDFQNADHLNQKGAEKLTRIINSYL